MRVQWMKIAILGLFAPLVGMTQEQAKRPTLKCQDLSCVHTVGSNWENTDGSQVNSYRRFRITGYRRVVASPYGKYWPATDELETNGIRIAATEAFNNWDPFHEGLALTNGVTNDKSIVGNYHIREEAPYGNLYTKGWFGSDEYNHLSHRIPTMRSRWEKWNQWSNSIHPHRGEATLYHKITSYTMLKQIGGWPFWDAGFSGYISPNISNYNTIRNIEGRRPEGNATVHYHQEKGSSTAINISGNAGFNAQDGAGAGINIGASGSISSTNPYLSIGAESRADVNGKATSTASIESENEINLFMFTNDMVSAWDIEVVLKRETLEIGSKKPFSSNKYEPDSNLPSSKTTTRTKPGLMVQNFGRNTSSSPYKATAYLVYPGRNLRKSYPSPYLLFGVEENAREKLKEWVNRYKTPKDAFEAADSINGDENKLHFDEILWAVDAAGIKWFQKLVANKILEMFGKGKDHITLPDLTEGLKKK